MCGICVVLCKFMKAWNFNSKALPKVRKSETNCHLNVISIQVKHVILIVKDLSRVLISRITSHIIS